MATWTEKTRPQPQPARQAIALLPFARFRRSESEHLAKGSGGAELNVRNPCEGPETLARARRESAQLLFARFRRSESGHPARGSGGRRGGACVRTRTIARVRLGSRRNPRKGCPIGGCLATTGGYTRPGTQPTQEASVLRIDLHVHTQERSGCGKSPELAMIEAAIAAGLDAVVLTDHDRLAPPERLAELGGRRKGGDPLRRIWLRRQRPGHRRAPDTPAQSKPQPSHPPSCR